MTLGVGERVESVALPGVFGYGTIIDVKSDPDVKEFPYLVKWDTGVTERCSKDELRKVNAKG